MATKGLVLASFYFDSRTTRISKGEVRHPSYTYEGRLISGGYIDKSISVPSGLYQGSEVVIEISETDRALRDFLCVETPLRRLSSLRLMPEGGSEAAYDDFGTFEILDAEFEAGKCRVTGRDITWSWIDKPLPGLGNRTNFDYLMADVDEFFFPILQGLVQTTTLDSPGSFQGQVLLPRMGPTTAGSPPIFVDRWACCQTPIIGVTVYRKLPDEELFTVVPQNSPADWVITEEEHTIDGITYDLQFLDFFDPQPAGTQIRVDYEGIFFRGEFGSMPAVQNSPLTPLRNPVDFLINILYALLANEPRLIRYNVDSFASVRTQLEGIITSTSPPSDYACDGAITEPITAREFLGRFLTSFELDLFVNRFGELTLSITTDEDPARPVFSQGPIFGESTDNSLILINSVRERLANPHVNRLRYNFARNYATGQWVEKRVRDNESDQLALGGSQSPIIPEVVEDTLEMWFVREENTAIDVARRRMEFLALGSYRIEFNAPLPEVFDDIELAKLIGVTSYWGLAANGYHNKEFKTTGLTYNLDNLMCTIRGVLREPIPIDAVGVVNQIPGFWVVDQGMKGGDATFERSEFYYNTQDYDDDVRHYFGGVVSSNDPDNNHNCYILDAVGDVVGTIVVPPNITAEERQLLQPVEWFPHAGGHKYKCRMGDFGSNGNGIPGIGNATWACLICEPSLRQGWTKRRLTYDMAGTLEQGPVGTDGEDKEDGTGYIGIAFDADDANYDAIPPDGYQQRPERYGVFQRIDSRWSNKVDSIRWETVHGWGGGGFGEETTHSRIVLASRDESVSSFQLIAHTGKGSHDGDNTTCDPIDTSGADLIVITCGYQRNVLNADPTISDNKGNTYTPLPAGHVGDNKGIRVFYKFNPTVGTNHIVSAAAVLYANFAVVHVLAFSGAHSSPFDQQAGDGAASGTSVSPTGVSGPLTPSQHRCLLITSIADSFTNARSFDDGNFSVLDQIANAPGTHFGGAVAYSIQPTAVAVDPTWSSSPDSGSLVASISIFLADQGGAADVIDYHESTHADDEEDPVDHAITGSVKDLTTDGEDYYVALIRNNGALVHCKGYKAQMQVLVTNVTSEDTIEFPYTISRTWADSDDVPILDRRQPADLRGAVAAYFEITGFLKAEGGHNYYLYDFGTSNSGTSGARITASALEFSSYGKQVLRTPNILNLLTHLNRYGVDYEETGSGKGWLAGSAKLIIVRQGGSITLP